MHNRRDWMKRSLGYTAASVFTHECHSDDSIGTLNNQLTQYRAQLDAVRRRNGGSRPLPAVRWFLLGCGSRRKFVYQDGRLSDARTREVLRRWDVADDVIVPPAATVLITTKSGMRVRIVEDEQAVWLTEGDRRESLSSASVKLPSFAGHPCDLALRVLHHEVLTNFVDGRPLPNLFVYEQPWHRDGAMMAMVLKTTGNLHLIRDWIQNLRDPFDRNNAGQAEPDNLGQVLYMVSLVGDRTHPVVATVREAIARFRKGDFIAGVSDFAEHPVYQTAWLKSGLQALGLDDPYAIPTVADSYASLVWWAFRDEMKREATRLQSDDYPYLTWASDHTHDTRNGQLGDRDFPLTWESEASEARYAGMRSISEKYEQTRTAAPHTWHAAEAFLRLLEDRFD
jgi:hypothetical protein